MKALLIEDSPEIASGVTLTFKLRWPEATVIATDEGKRGVTLVETESPDIVILDLNLPDISGFDVLKQIRLFSDVPVIILSVRGDEIDQLRGLEMGADDYIVKPFSPSALLSRVRAILRRTGVRSLGEEKLPPMVAENIVIKFSTREVLVNNEPVHLTPTEGRVLFCLARNRGKVLTHESLKQQVWGNEARFVEDGILKRYIYQLRSKLGDTTESPRLILSERGMGYRFTKPQ